MPHSIVFALLVVSLSNCAAPLAAPTLYPATMAVQWDCVDQDAREDLVRGVARIEHDSALAVIDARAAQQAAEARQRQAHLDADSNRAWAWVGKFGIVGMVVIGVVGGVFAISSALRR